MPKFPYFKWYPADAMMDPDYYLMSLDAIGLYHILLNWAWLNDGLPCDPKEIVKLTKINRQTFMKAWAQVELRFPLDPSTDPPRRRSPRQQRERLDAISKSVKAAKSVSVRYERTTTTNANVAPRALARADCVSVSDSEKELRSKKNLGRARVDIGERFQEWIRPWERVADLDGAARAWISVVHCAEDEAAAFAARDRYLASDEIARGVWTAPEKWLFEQSRSGFAGRWPQQREEAKKMSMEDRVIAKLRGEKNGTN